MKITFSVQFEISLHGKNNAESISDSIGMSRSRKWKMTREAIRQRDGGICRYCQMDAQDGAVDHIIPSSRGGSDEPENLAWSCRSCNSSKGDKTIDEWREYLEISDVKDAIEQSNDSGIESLNPDTVTENLSQALKDERIRDMLKSGKSQSAIISTVWGTTGGRSYQLASEELRQIVQRLVK